MVQAMRDIFSTRVSLGFISEGIELWPNSLGCRWATEVRFGKYTEGGREEIAQITCSPLFYKTHMSMGPCWRGVGR